MQGCGERGLKQYEAIVVCLLAHPLIDIIYSCCLQFGSSNDNGPEFF